MATSICYRDDENTSAPLPFLDPSESIHGAQPPRSRRFQLHTLSVIMGLVFLLDLSGSLMSAPNMRIMETILCRDFYKKAKPSLIGNHGAVDEKYCKINPVQETLAFLNGWDTFFANLPGLFLAIPFGMLADKYGRKWLMVLGVSSIFLRALWIYTVFALPETFPIRLMWLQGALTILGGGTTVLTALFLVVMTDVTLESERATVFFCAQSIVFATSLLGPPMSSLLMNKNVWIPMNISLGINALSVLLALALPETISKSHRNRSDDGHDQKDDFKSRHADSSSIYSLHSTKSTSELKDFESSSNDSTPSSPSDIYSSPLKKPTILSHSTSSLASILPAYRFLLHDWRILFLIAAASAQTIADVSNGLVLQYVPKRFTWTISQANYLTSLRAIIGIISLLMLLPLASKYLLAQKTHSAFSKDVLLCRISAALVTTGILIDGLAPTISLFVLGLFVQTLGSGTGALIRSLSAGLVKRDEVARLYTAVSLAQTLTMVLAPPLFARLFKEGMKKGGGWIGLPLLVGGLLFGIATGGMWALPFGSAKEKRSGVEEGIRGEE